MADIQPLAPSKTRKRFTLSKSQKTQEKSKLCSSTPLCSEKNNLSTYNKNNKHENYGKEKEAIIDSLTQRLSVIKGELWYNVSAGLPLLEKDCSTFVNCDFIFFYF